MSIPVNSNKNTNCIKTDAQCIEWNHGSIEYLGICNGDMLPEIIWEIVNKLKVIAGQDLSSFDIDTLLTVCNQRVPFEKNLITILELLRDNQLCLKDYIDTLAEQIAELSKEQKVNVNLKCLADFDNFGNQLGVTREALDQIVVDKLCNHEDRILTVEGKIISLQNQINNIDVNPQVQEPEFTTCVDPSSKPTSGQVVSIANKLCSIESYLGDNLDASNARSSYNFEDSRYNLIDGWLITSQRENILDDYNNLLIVVKDLEARIIDIQTNCCAPTCDKVQIGFSIIEVDGDYIMRFRPSDGTNLFGFQDNDSEVRFTGTDKVTGLQITAGPFPIDVSEEENDIMLLSGTFDLSKPITVSLKVKVVKDGLVCEKCIAQTLDISSGCPVCELIAGGTKGGAAIITLKYRTNGSVSSLILKEGESGWIPKDAEVVAVIDPDNIGVTSGCEFLDLTPTTGCYIFTWDTFNEPNAVLKYIEVDNIQIPISGDVSIDASNSAFITAFNNSPSPYYDLIDVCETPVLVTPRVLQAKLRVYATGTPYLFFEDTSTIGPIPYGYSIKGIKSEECESCEEPIT